jgi:hypothetical protein
MFVLCNPTVGMILTFVPLRPTTSTRLSMNKLTGTLSPSFGAAWPAMEKMNLQTNAFTGPLPIEWAKMSKLRILILV